MADDIARLGFEIDSTQALSAARNLLTMEQAAGKAEVAGAKLQRVFRNAKGQFADAADGARLHKREIEQLAAKYNTALSAELAFANAQKEVARAVQLGVLSSSQAGAALEALQAQYMRTGTAATTMGTQIGAANRHILNMGFQFQDIGMMMASGQNPLILAMQQGTQVAGIFNQVRMEGQSVFGVLRSGFMQLINPTSLLTIGIIAGTAALVQWGLAALGASDDTQTFADATDDLIDAMDRYREAIGNSEQLTTQLLERYGTQAQAMRANLELMARLERIRFTTAVEEGVTRIRSELGEIAQIANGIATASGNTPEWLQQWIADFRMTSAEAVALGAAIDDLGSQQTPDALATSLETVSRILISVHERGGDVTDEMIETVLETLRAAAAARELAGALADASTNAAAIQIPIGMDSLYDDAGNYIGLSGVELPPPSRRLTSGGGSNERANRLRQFIDELRTETETVQAWRTEQLDLLAQYNNAELEAIGGHNEARLRIEQEYADRMREIHDAERQERLSGYSTMFGDLATLMNTESMKLFRIGQAAAIANAVMEGWESAVSAWRWGMKFGGPPLAAAASAASLAKTGAMIANIAKQNPKGSGGSGGGGGSLTGSTAPEQGSGREVLVEFRGPDWAKEMLTDMLDQIYESAGDGRVIIR